jgi:hypothetical protein
VLDDAKHVAAQRGDRGRIRFATCANGDIHRHTGGHAASHRGQQLETCQLAQPALEPVSVDGGVLMKGNHDGDA